MLNEHCSSSKTTKPAGITHLILPDVDGDKDWVDWLQVARDHCFVPNTPSFLFNTSPFYQLGNALRYGPLMMMVRHFWSTEVTSYSVTVSPLSTPSGYLTGETQEPWCTHNLTLASSLCPRILMRLPGISAPHRSHKSHFSGSQILNKLPTCPFKKNYSRSICRSGRT